MTDTQSTPRSSAKRDRSLAHLYLLCLGFVALTIATLMTRRPAPKPAAAGTEVQHYLYCPECELEMTCPPEYVKQGMVCPHCGAGRKMKVTTHSLSGGQGPLAASRWMIPLVFGVPVAVAVVVFVLERGSKRPRVAAGPPQSHVDCPRCGHRMSTAMFGPGSLAICPECAEHFRVPGQAAPRKKKYKPEVIRENKKPKPRQSPGEKPEGRSDEGPALTQP
jgi:hypothetical protein